MDLFKWRSYSNRIKRLLNSFPLRKALLVIYLLCLLRSRENYEFVYQDALVGLVFDPVGLHRIVKAFPKPVGLDVISEAIILPDDSPLEVEISSTTDTGKDSGITDVTANSFTMEVIETLRRINTAIAKLLTGKPSPN